jgi:hypothetical protein
MVISETLKVCDGGSSAGYSSINPFHPYVAWDGPTFRDFSGKINFARLRGRNQNALVARGAA